MDADVENLLLEHLRALRSELADFKRDGLSRGLEASRRCLNQVLARREIDDEIDAVTGRDRRLD